MKRAVTLLVAAVLSCLVATPAGATGDAGASTRVVGRGDIVTSILGWNGRRASGGGSSPPKCAWHTLSDAQLEWLIAVAARGVALGYRSSLLEPLDALLASGDTIPEGNLLAYVCGADTYELRFAPADGPRSLEEQLVRRMITRLPSPEPDLSPPDGTVVPVGQPVFVSIRPEDWRPIDTTLSSDGLTAEVHAEPVGLRVISGDPSVPPVLCPGPGRAFDPDEERSPAAQARSAAACAVTYRTVTRDLPVDHGRASTAAPRPDAWLGTITVVWSARWRVDGGAWIDLGDIPRTRLVAREVRELSTTIQQPG
jgi:hypothetical protein